MNVFTSTDFASACASGTDWRDTSKSVLEKLDSIRTEGDEFNFGFIYISDYLADDATSIYNLFKSVLKIDNWVGSVGMGVIGNNESLLDKPAISAMIGKFPEGSFRVFPQNASDVNDIENSKPYKIEQDAVQQWLVENNPMLGIAHLDPLSDNDPQETLLNLESSTGSFIIGGLTSSRSQHFQIANDVFDNGVGGVLFADTIPVSTTLSQGCLPLENSHVITKADENVILELDDKRAIDVLQSDLRALAGKKIGTELNEFSGSFSEVESSDKIPGEFKSLFRGQIHVALPFSQSDQKDFMVRNIIGMDDDEGSVSISEHITGGQRMFFVERDEKSVSSDLSTALIALRKRVTHERGCFEPKGAIYISCIARGFSEDNSGAANEMALIHDIIGDIPLTGFYAGGEVNNARLYSYTGVIALFF